MRSRRIHLSMSIGVALGAISAAAVLAGGLTDRALVTARADAVTNVANFKWTPIKP